MTKPPIHPSLQRVLNASNHSLQDIADLLGVSMTTLTRWSKHGISQAGANKLGKLLGLDPAWILTGQHNRSTTPKKRELIAKEAMLEFVQDGSGKFNLREVGDGEVWVSIDFSEKIAEMLGKETLQMVGQHMIQAGIASFMEKQMRQYHAHVYDETPTHFS